MSNKNKISLDTQITFTLKMFFSLIAGIIILFFGFYKLVIAPDITDNKTLIMKNNTTQTKQYTEITKQLMEMNNGIGTLNGTVAGFGERFNDLRHLKESETTSGGFTNNN